MVAFNLALKNIIRKQERSLLTVIGVVLAVGCFVALLSVAEGLNQKLNKEVYGRKVDIYILPSSGSSMPSGPIGSIGYSADSVSIIRNLPVELAAKPVKAGAEVPREQGNLIDFLSPDRDARMPNIKKAVGITRFQQNIKGKSVMFWGIPYESMGYTDENTLTAFFPHMKILSGMLPILPEESNQDPYCIYEKRTIPDLTEDEKTLTVGTKMSKELNTAVGKAVSFRRNSERIDLTTQCIASFREGFQDYFCFLPLQTAMAVEDTAGKVHEIWIQVEDPSKLRETKRILAINFPDLTVQTNEEYLGASSELVRYAWFLQFAIALIGVLIAMTASMNTMLMSTFERVKEFGALRAIGASRFTIVSMIFIESLILSVSGGCLGIMMGVLGSYFLDGALTSMLRISFPLAHITFNLIIYAFVLSVVIGIVGAVIPAVIVYRMGILKALK